MAMVKTYSIILFFVFSLLLLSKVFFLSSYPDFAVYYMGAKAFWAGYNPYLFIPNQHLTFLYSPFSLLIFTPLVFFSILTAGKLWTVLSFLVFLASLLLLFHYYRKKIDFFIFLIVCTLSFLSFPVKFTLGMGQINMFILFFLTISLLIDTKKYEVISGMIYGISLSIKTFPLLVVVLYFIEMKKKILLGIGLSCLGVLTFLLLSPLQSLVWPYLQTIYSLGNAQPAEYYNQALSGFLVRMMGNSSIEVFIKYILSAVMVGSTIYISKKYAVSKHGHMFLPSLFITLSLLCNAFSWQHHFVLLLIPYFSTLVIVLSNEENKKNLLIMLFCSYLLVSSNFPSPQQVPVLFLSHVFYGTMLLWGVQLYVLIRKYV